MTDPTRPTALRRLLVALTGLLVVTAGACVATPASAAESTPETAEVATTVPFSVGQSEFDLSDPVEPASDPANLAVAASCLGGRPIYRPRWVRFTPTVTTTIAPEASASRHENDEESSWTSGVALLDDQRQVVDCESGRGVNRAGPTTVEAGSTVYLVVFTTEGSCCAFVYGSFSLVGKAAVPQPVDDDWQNATPITSLPFRQSVDVSSATLQGSADDVDVSGCSIDDIKNARTVWWRYTPLVSGPLRFGNGPFGSTLGFAKLTDHGPEPFDACAPGGQQPAVFEYGTTYLIQGGVSRDRYEETTDYAGLNGPVSISVDAVGRSRAATSDLVVTKVSTVPATPKAGEPVRFAAKVRNVGLGATPGGVTHQVTFFVDGKPVSGSTLWDGSLAQGESVTLTADAVSDLPSAWMATAGTHTLRAYVDPGRLIERETSETNNTLTRSLVVAAQTTATEAGGADPAAVDATTALPDLVVRHVTWRPRSPRPGDQVRLSATIENVGNRPTPSGVPLRVSFRPGGAPAGATLGRGGRLRPGQRETVTATSTWRPTSGANPLVVRLDALDAVHEGDETNNAVQTFVTAG